MGLGLPSHHRPGDHIIGQDRANVEHLCPECGGETAVHIGASLLVELCTTCLGRGVVTDAGLSAWLARMNREPQGMK